MIIKTAVALFLLVMWQATLPVLSETGKLPKKEIDRSGDRLIGADYLSTLQSAVSSGRQQVCKAIESIRSLAEAGQVDAQYNLGVLLLNFTSKTDEAVRLIEAAAEHGDSSAQMTLADFYRRGKYVEQNQGSALDLYEKLAIKGVTEASVELASMYLNGEGTEKSDAHAATILHAAAASGNSRAKFLLAKLYIEGKVVEYDPCLALSFMRAAAIQGDTNAQLALADMYATGKAVQQDRNESIRWLKRAFESGSKDAEKRLSQIRLRTRVTQ